MASNDLAAPKTSGGWLDRRFALSARNTSVRSETLAGITSFLAAAYLLWLYQRVFFGTVTNPKNEKLHDLTPREVLTFVPLLIMAFWIGLYPKPYFDVLAKPVQSIVERVQAK